MKRVMSGTFVMAFLIGVVAVGFSGTAQQSAVEAPAGFDTPTLAQNRGSQSRSNGIAQPPGDDYALDRARFEQDHDISSGLGPVFNARACAECHQNPVSGGSSSSRPRVCIHGVSARTNWSSSVSVKSDTAQKAMPSRVQWHTSKPRRARVSVDASLPSLEGHTKTLIVCCRR